MTSKYMNFSPQLVNERNAALNKCPTKSGRSQIYRTYYLKMKDAYENYEEEIEAEEYYDDEDDEDDEDYEGEEEEEDECEEEYEEDASEAEASEADEEASEAEASEAEADEPENEVIESTDTTEYCCCDVESDEDENGFGCPGCNYEWRDGYKNGWRDAMKYITNKTHKVVPPTPACSYCDIVCKTHKCGGKCGGTARYCSIECQKQDWAFGHKANCGK